MTAGVGVDLLGVQLEPAKESSLAHSSWVRAVSPSSDSALVTLGIYSFWVVPRLTRWTVEHQDFS